MGQTCKKKTPRRRDLRLSLVLQVIVKCRVRLEDTEGVFQCQGMWIGDGHLSERLHECSGTDVEAAECRQEEDQLSNGRENELAVIARAC